VLTLQVHLHERGPPLIKAGNKLNCKNLIVLIENEERADTAEWFGIQETIRFLPLGKWLLVVPGKNHDEPAAGSRKKMNDIKNNLVFLHARLFRMY